VPTDWQQRYETGDMPWEKGRACPGLVDHLETHPVTGRVLVPGCGFGHDARALAACPEHPEVIGLDLAPAAIAGALRFPAPPGLRFEQGDFLDLPDRFHNGFDWLWEHTLYCAIDPGDRPRYARSAAQAVRPGGFLFGIFYLNPDHDGPGPPHGTTPEELDRRFSPDFELVRQWLPARAYPGREGREMLRLYRRRDVAAS
jgi:SAM-dependent methyltransferase